MIYAKLGFLAVAAVALGLGGCVSPGNVPEFAKAKPGKVKETPQPAPQTETDKSPRVEEIIHHLNCELRQADKNSRLSNAAYTIGVNLTVVVEDEIGTSPSLTYKEPLEIADTAFSAVLAGEWSRGRTRKFTTAYTLDATKLQDRGTSDKPKPDPCALAGADEHGLRGDLGIAQIITDGFAAKSTSALFAKDDPDTETGPSFGSTVEFVVTKSFKAGGGWSLKRYVTPGDSAYKEKRVTKDTVILAFNPVYPPKPSQLAALNEQIKLLKSIVQTLEGMISNQKLRLALLENTPDTEKSLTYKNNLNIMQNNLDATEKQIETLKKQIAEVETQAAGVNADDGKTDSARQSRRAIDTQILQNIRD